MILPEMEKRKIINGLDFIVNCGLKLVLIGGTAVVHYLKESRNLTPDLDFLTTDIEKLKERLDRNNINYDNLINGLGITVDKFNADFLDSRENKKLNTMILSSCNTARIAGYYLNIISLELLFIMKMKTARSKDIDDAFSILTSGLLNKQEFLNYCFNEYDSLVAFAEMM